MLKFFDSNCCVGKRNTPREGAPNILSDFVEIMDRCGVEKAIVNHSVAVESDIMTGNLLLEDEIGDDPRFIKRWVIAPEFLDVFPSAKKFEEYFRIHNVKAAKIIPDKVRHSLRPNVFGELAEMLSSHNIPLFVDKNAVSWEEFESFFENFPKLKVVISDPTYRDLLRFWYNFKNYSNVYVETSNFVAHNALKHFTDAFGSDRILFGSNMPISSCAAGVSLVRYADISDSDKEKIAHGNIERILSEVTL